MWVRSSTAFYGSFNLDMDRSPGFGSASTDSFALLRLGFPSAPHLKVLNLASIRNSPDRSTKSTRLYIKILPQLVNIRFQVLFHSPPGVLFTFPSQYYALSVTKEYLALGGGPPDFPQGFSCLVVLRIPLAAFCFHVRGFHPLAGFPKTVPLTSSSLPAVHYPRVLALWFRLFPFRSPLLRKSMFLSLPPPT